MYWWKKAGLGMLVVTPSWFITHSAVSMKWNIFSPVAWVMEVDKKVYSEDTTVEEEDGDSFNANNSKKWKIIITIKNPLTLAYASKYLESL